MKRVFEDKDNYGLKRLDSILVVVTNFIVAICMVAVIAFVYFFVSDDYKWPTLAGDQTSTSFNQGWLIYTFDELDNLISVRGNVDFPVYLGDRRADRMTLVNTIPTGISAKGNYLSTTILYQYMDVRVDGKLIFRNKGDSYFENVGPYIGVQNIKLPDSCDGETIEITLTSPYSSQLGMISDFHLGTYEQIVADNLFSNGVGSVINIGVMLAALLFMIIIFIMAVGESIPDAREYKSLAVSLFFGSVWCFLGGASGGYLAMPPMIRGILALASIVICMVMYLNYLRYRFDRNDLPLMGLNVLFIAFIVVTVAASLIKWKFMFIEWEYMFIVFLTLIVVAHFYGYGRFVLKKISLNIVDIGTVFFLICLVRYCSITVVNPIYLYFPQVVSVGIMGLLVSFIAHVAVTLIATNRRNLKAYEENYEATVKLFVQRLNPHFLYNAFGAVGSTALVDGKYAYELNSDLAYCLRYSMDSLQDQTTVDIEKELTYIQCFAKIQKRRFGECVNVRVENSGIRFQIPRLTLQPFVEYTINYIRNNKIEDGEIVISVSQDREYFRVTMLNNMPADDYSELFMARELPMEEIKSRLRNYVNGTLKIENIKYNGIILQIEVPK